MDMFQASHGNWGPGQLAPLLAPLLFLFFIMRRNLRQRPLRIPMLFVTPIFFLAMLGVSLYFAPPRLDPLVDAILLGMLLIGAVIGWQRGKFTLIEKDPATGALMTRVSPIGIAILMVIFLVRYALRDFMFGPGSVIPLSPLEITDGFLLMAFGLITATRAEIWIRAQQMREDTAAGRDKPTGGDPIVS